MAPIPSAPITGHLLLPGPDSLTFNTLLKRLGSHSRIFSLDTLSLRLGLPHSTYEALIQIPSCPLCSSLCWSSGKGAGLGRDATDKYSSVTRFASPLLAGETHGATATSTSQRELLRVSREGFSLSLFLCREHLRIHNFSLQPSQCTVTHKLCRE